MSFIRVTDAETSLENLISASDISRIFPDTSGKAIVLLVTNQTIRTTASYTAVKTFLAAKDLLLN